MPRRSLGSGIFVGHPILPPNLSLCQCQCDNDVENDGENGDDNDIDNDDDNDDDNDIDNDDEKNRASCRDKRLVSRRVGQPAFHFLLV